MATTETTPTVMTRLYLMRTGGLEVPMGGWDACIIGSDTGDYWSVQYLRGTNGVVHEQSGLTRERALAHYEGAKREMLQHGYDISICKTQGPKGRMRPVSWKGSPLG